MKTTLLCDLEDACRFMLFLFLETPRHGVHGGDNTHGDCCDNRNGEDERDNHRQQDDPPDGVCRAPIATHRWCVPERAFSALQVLCCGAVRDVCEVGAHTTSQNVVSDVHAVTQKMWCVGTLL